MSWIHLKDQNTPSKVPSTADVVLPPCLSQPHKPSVAGKSAPSNPQTENSDLLELQSSPKPHPTCDAAARQRKLCRCQSAAWGTEMELPSADPSARQLLFHLIFQLRKLTVFCDWGSRHNPAVPQDGVCRSQCSPYSQEGSEDGD